MLVTDLDRNSFRVFYSLSKGLDLYALLLCRCGDLHMPKARMHSGPSIFFNGKRGLRLSVLNKGKMTLKGG